MNLPGPLNPLQRLLLGPVPRDVHPRVLSAMATPLLGHLDPAFLELMQETQQLLRAAYLTKNPLTFPVSATGMAGMEACLVNLVEPGDQVGSARRLLWPADDGRGRAGGGRSPCSNRRGRGFKLERIRDTLNKVRPVLSIVQAETSTSAAASR